MSLFSHMQKSRFSHDILKKYTQGELSLIARKSVFGVRHNQAAELQKLAKNDKETREIASL